MPKKIEIIDSEKIKNLIITKIKESNPETTKQLINLIEKDEKIPEEKLFSIIQELEDEKKIQFNELIFPQSAMGYLFSFRAAWYWTIIVISIISALFVFTIPANLIPQIYARSVLSLILLLFFPGYVLIKALYPMSVPLKTRSITLDMIERIALSLALSLTIIPTVGLILYYTPLGLNLAPITLSLLAVTFFLGAFAIVREYQAKRVFFLRRLIVVSQYDFSNNLVNFFDLKGLLRNRLVLIKQIPISEITNIDSFKNELSITWNGITDIFFIQSDFKSVVELREKIRSMRLIGK